jgi:uncharacterized membrane protein
MTIFAALAAWLACAVVFLAADFLWLGVIAKRFYQRQIGHLLAKRFRARPALLFYAVYVAGIVWFAVADATAWHDAALNGGLFGFFCYATYNLTNYATLRDWPRTLTIADTTWGTLLSAGTAIAGYVLPPLLFPG